MTEEDDPPGPPAVRASGRQPVEPGADGSNVTTRREPVPLPAPLERRSGQVDLQVSPPGHSRIEPVVDPREQPAPEPVRNEVDGPVDDLVHETEAALGQPASGH
jgi:hypothetical protein